MAKNDDSFFGIATLPSYDHGMPGQMISYQPSQAAAKFEQRTWEELHKQELLISGQAIKTNLGMTKIAEMHQHGLTTFDNAVGQIFAIKEQPRGKQPQAVIDEFTMRQIGIMGRGILSTIEIGATNVARVVHEPFNPPPEAPEPRSLWKRLFG